MDKDPRFREVAGCPLNYEGAYIPILSAPAVKVGTYVIVETYDALGGFWEPLSIIVSPYSDYAPVGSYEAILRKEAEKGARFLATLIRRTCLSLGLPAPAPYTPLPGDKPNWHINHGTTY